MGHWLLHVTLSGTLVLCAAQSLCNVWCLWPLLLFRNSILLWYPVTLCWVCLYSHVTHLSSHLWTPFPLGCIFQWRGRTCLVLGVIEVGGHEVEAAGGRIPSSEEICFQQKRTKPDRTTQSCGCIHSLATFFSIWEHGERVTLTAVSQAAVTQ